MGKRKIFYYNYIPENYDVRDQKFMEKDIGILLIRLAWLLTLKADVVFGWGAARMMTIEVEMGYLIDRFGQMTNGVGSTLRDWLEVVSQTQREWLGE